MLEISWNLAHWLLIFIENLWKKLSFSHILWPIDRSSYEYNPEVASGWGGVVGGIYPPPPTEGCYYWTPSMWGGGMEKIVKVRGDPYVFFIWESGTKICPFEAISQKISFDGWIFSVSQRLLQIRYRITWESERVCRWLRARGCMLISAVPILTVSSVKVSNFRRIDP